MVYGLSAYGSVSTASTMVTLRSSELLLHLAVLLIYYRSIQSIHQVYLLATAPL